VLGWVSYAISALYASVSNARLMPSRSECPCLVVTAKNGYIRSNSSWVISRVVRDFEYWMDAAVRTKLDDIMHDRYNYMKKQVKPGTAIIKPKKSGLCISVYEPCQVQRAGSPIHDMVYWSGFLVAFIQLVIAMIPIVVARDWSVMVITGVGIILGLLTGALPQWEREKWFSRRNAKSAYILTRGNGAQHALLILGNGHGLNLEDLAIGAENLDTVSAGWGTRICLFILGCLWIALLVGAAGFSQPSWYLLSVDGIGMLQNLAVAGWRRNPSALGIHLQFRKTIGHMSTMDALLQVEAEFPNAGRSLLPIFFPGPLFPDETAKWEALKVKQEQDAAAQTQQQIQSSLPPPQLTVPTSWILHAKSYET
jgi:hypothetical protein